MLDRLSPLAHDLKPGRYGAQSDAPVILGERPIASLWQIAGWADFDAAAAPALAACGFDAANDYRTSVTNGDATAYRIAPDRILIEGAPDLDSFATDALTVLDLSHARTAITLSGPKARTLLSQLTSVDMSAASFDVGHFVQTGMHHIGVLLKCVGPDRFEILVPSTWAATLWDAICVNAMPLGYEVREQST